MVFQGQGLCYSCQIVTHALLLQLYFRSILEEKLIANKSIYLAHPALERQALLLLKWHWWFGGHKSCSVGAQIMLHHSPRALNERGEMPFIPSFDIKPRPLDTQHRTPSIYLSIVKARWFCQPKQLSHFGSSNFVCSDIVLWPLTAMDTHVRHTP